MAESQADYRIKFTEAPGESRRTLNEIDIDNWHVGVSNGGSAGYGSGAGVGKCSWSNFTCSMKTNTSTSKLLALCASGQHLPSVELTAYKAGGSQEPFLKMKFEKVLITSLTVGGIENDIPRDQLSFDYKTVEVIYKAQDDRGTLSGAYPMKWDVASGKAA